MKVVVPFAQGFEEIEAVSIVDVLRRVNIDVTTLYTKTNPVIGSHSIKITADKNIDDVSSAEFDFIVLPGGMPGSKNLKEDEKVISLIKDIYNKGGYVAALCAAPIALAQAGILEGKKATCFPGFEEHLTGAEYIPEPVIVDGRIITGKGPGCAIPFALKLVETILDSNTSTELKNGMQVYWM